MVTIEDMLAISKEYDAHKSDWTANAQDVGFDPYTADLVLGATLFGQVPPMHLTDWALAQVCQKTGHITAGYAKDCPPWLRATNLNHWMHNINKDLMVRGYEQEGQLFCRAVLSAQYSPIMNSVVLEKTAQIMQGVQYYETHYLDADTLHAKFTVGNRPGGDRDAGGFGVGFYLGNGETGNRAVRVAPYIQRTQCFNSIVFQDWGIEIRHYRTTPAYIFGAIKETIGKAIGMAADAVNRFVEAEMTAIPEVSSVIDNLVEKYGLSTPIHDAILFGMEGQSTLAGVINGLSYAAQKIENPDQRIDMESLAGAILVDPSVLKRKTPIQLNVLDEIGEDDREPVNMRGNDHTFIR